MRPCSLLPCPPTPPKSPSSFPVRVPNGRHGRDACVPRCRPRGRCSIGRRPCSATTCYKLCTEGPAAKLDSTVHSQPALFVASLAALEQLKQDSPELVERCVGRGRLEPGRVHGAGVCRRDGFRSRPARRAGARPGDAGRGRRRVERHGQRPGPGARASRSALRRGPRRRNAAKSPTCSARATSSSPATTAACERLMDAGRRRPAR